MRVVGEDGTERTANHGVFAHQDDTHSTESDTNLMHLVGSDIVDVDQKDGGWDLSVSGFLMKQKVLTIFGEELLKLFKVNCLISTSSTHCEFCLAKTPLQCDMSRMDRNTDKFVVSFN